MTVHTVRTVEVPPKPRSFNEVEKIIKGATVKQDKDGIVELYGRYVPIGSILGGKLHAPASTDTFLSAVRRYAPEALRSRNAPPGSRRTRGR